VSERVIINDVGPRDGLQNQPKILSVAEKTQLVEALLAAQIRHVELGAFVSPKAVPAMAGTDQVVAAFNNELADFSVLVPNQKGYDLALAAGSKIMAMVAYATDGMAQKNVQMSRQQADEATLAMAAQAKHDGTKLLATIATSFECPFDGKADPAIVAEATNTFLNNGVDMVIIADTIGAANPAQVRSLMNRLVAENGADRLACHFHDTRALGMANVYAALESGIRRFDASIGGLGGCPFAPGASGNIATEDAVMMLEQMGFDTGIDLDALIRASDLAVELTGTAPGGRAKPWLKPYLAKTIEHRKAS
jgi:hydroxymethylglutaryl-CoA lyase